MHGSDTATNRTDTNANSREQGRYCGLFDEKNVSKAVWTEKRVPDKDPSPRHSVVNCPRRPANKNAKTDLASPTDAGLRGNHAQAESRMQAETFAVALLSRQGTFTHEGCIMQILFQDG